MTPCPNPTQIRCAMRLAVGTSACCTALTLLALTQVPPRSHPESTVETLLWWATATLLAGLAWSSGCAAASCRRELRSRAHPTAAIATRGGRARGWRAAGRFVTIAGLLTTSTPTAMAATSANQNSTPAPSFRPIDHVPHPSCEASPEPEWTSVDPSVARACTRATPASQATSRPPTHVVARGETLWGIVAGQPQRGQEGHGNDVAGAVKDWLRANPGLASHPDVLHPGDRLAVPSAPEHSGKGRS